MTEQVVSYIDLPKEQRQKRKSDSKAQKNQPMLGNRWFGVLPVAIKSIFKRAQ